MKIYLDTCSLQRPFDGKEQVRVALEAEAVLGIVALHDGGKVQLISSEALLFENQRVAEPTRKEFALAVLRQAELFVQVTGEVQNRARDMIAKGLMPLDALHLASAQEAWADYFCTCDDKLIRKAKPICEPGMKVGSPVQLLQEVGDES